jgi:hypothetical protein
VSLLASYRPHIIAEPHLHPASPALLIEQSGALSCHYAPFDHINRTARIVLLGMTPGTQQARNALSELRNCLIAGTPDEHALHKAKEFASFSGPIRNNLVAMLDHVGMSRLLGLSSCADLFTSRAELVHFTSALRYPVFVNGKDYSGSPSIISTTFLRNLSERWLSEEAEILQDAFWIPLGKEAKAALDLQVARGTLSVDRVLDGMVHPSPSNAERIAYFLGRKPREALSNRTDPMVIDSGKVRLLERLAGSAPNGPLPPAQSALSSVTAKGTTPCRADKTTSPSPVTAVPASLASTPLVQQAEALIATRMERTRRPTVKIAGFQTPRGRQLAIQRDALGIQVWTENVAIPSGFDAVPIPYTATRPRHSNLASQAPRVATGREANLWKLPTIGELERLLAWYLVA